MNSNVVQAELSKLLINLEVIRLMCTTCNCLEEFAESPNELVRYMWIGQLCYHCDSISREHAKGLEPMKGEAVVTFSWISSTASPVE